MCSVGSFLSVVSLGICEGHWHFFQLWKISPFVILWSVWKEKNGRFFRGASVFVDDVVHLVAVRVAKWVSMAGFDSLRVDGVPHTWEATLSNGARKVEGRFLQVKVS